MEPKELAEKFKAKAAAKASKNEAAKVALELKRADAAKVEEEEAVKRAFELVVVPYLDECRATFPPNEFAFDTQTDANDDEGKAFETGRIDNRPRPEWLKEASSMPNAIKRSEAA